MARETCPAMLMITSSPAPDSAGSVTSVWRLFRQWRFHTSLPGALVHAVLKDIIGWVESFGSGFPKAKYKPLRTAFTKAPNVPGARR
jgi:hypothetical protein